MPFVSWKEMLRVLKPVVAGVALAYVATAYLDGPPPVNFQPDSNTAKQAEIVEPQAELVIEKNIMKLGSLLSIKAVETGPGPLNRDGDDIKLFYAPDAPGELPTVKGLVSEPGS